MEQLADLISALTWFLFIVWCLRFLSRLDRILTLVEIQLGFPAEKSIHKKYP